MADEEAGSLDYIRQHKVHHLFERLADVLLKEKPKRPLRFLIPVLQSMADLDEPEESNIAAAEEALKKYDPTQEDRSVEPSAGPGSVKKLKITLVVFGLDNAGKSTFISALSGKLDTETKPTVGFSPTRLAGDEFDVLVYDLGGGSRFRGIWPQYYADVHGIIYMVDSADPDRFEESRDCLHQMMADERSSGKPLLLLANKQDTPGAASLEQLTSSFKVDTLGSPYKAWPCCAVNPESPHHVAVQESVEWLLLTIKSHYEDLAQRIKKQLQIDKERRKKEFEEQKKRVAERKEREAEEKAQQG